jgi:DNA polymerase-3 subunit epsilon
MTALMDAHIHEVPLAIVDLEMTGLRDFDEPIEVAVAHWDPGEALPRLAFHSRVCPTVEMSQGAQRVTGLTDRDLSGNPSWSGVIDDVVAALQGRAVVAFNAPADYRWLTADRLNVPRHVLAEIPSWPWLDPLVLVKHLDKYEKHKTLQAACGRAGIVLDAHGAAGDALATALLWAELLGRRLRETWRTTLLEYIEWQGGTALAQERDFCAYVRRTYGTQGQRPDCPWHLLEGVALPDWPEPIQTWGTCRVCGEAGIRYAVSKDGTLTAMSVGRPAAVPHGCPGPKVAPQVPDLDDSDDADEDIPW